MCLKYSLTALVLAFIPLSAYSANEVNVDGPSSITADSAINYALEYTGIDGITGYFKDANVEAEIAVVNDDKTPFIHKMINGKRIWIVRFSDIPAAAFRNFKSIVDRPPIDIEVWLDSESGKLLKIWSRLKDTAYIVPRPKSTFDSDDSYTSRGIEYTGLPDEMPIPFWDIITKCPGRCSPLRAIELEALFVLEKTPIHKTAVPHWIVYLFGVPERLTTSPISTDSGLVEYPGKDIMMSYEILFDGLTGELITVGGGGK